VIGLAERAWKRWRYHRRQRKYISNPSDRLERWLGAALVGAFAWGLYLVVTTLARRG
jgi:hypothetical protein